LVPEKLFRTKIGLENLGCHYFQGYYYKENGEKHLLIVSREIEERKSLQE